MKTVLKTTGFLFVFLVTVLAGFSVHATSDVSYFTVKVIGENCSITKCDADVSGLIIIPETIAGRKVVNIGEKAFYNCKSITEIILPETVVEIGNAAFSGCANLTGFNMPDSVRIIQESVFAGCTALENVDLSSSLAVVPKNTFYRCCNLRTVSIGENTTVLGQSAFSGCVALKKIAVGENLLAVSANCFYGCTSLESVCLPSSLISIDTGAFKDCNALSGIYYCGNEAEFDEIMILSGNESLTESEKSYNHSHDEADSVTVVGTSCTQDGYILYGYDCGHPERRVENPASGHNLAVREIVKQPSCIARGVVHINCTECDYYETEYIAKTAHKSVTDKAVKATCETAGKTKGSHCSVCSTVLVKQNSIAAIGHDFSVKISDEAHCASKATYISAAKYYYTCSLCGIISSDKTFTGKKLELGKVKNFSFTSSADTVTLSWNKVPEAMGYAVYSKTNNGKLKLYKRVRSDSIKISDLSQGKVYNFYVRAYLIEKDKIVYAPEYTSIKTATRPKAPSEISSRQNEHSITITWSQVKGATSYRIYKYDSKTEKWSTVVSKTKLCNYTITGLRSGYRYKFAVRALINTGTTDVSGEKYKSILTCTRPEKPVPKATSLKCAVRLEWEKISGAEGYVIYVSEDPGLGYEKAMTTKLLRRKISGLKSGRTYYFKVRAYRTVSGKRVYSYFCDIKKVKTR